MPLSADILLLACYEMGHQPLSLAWPAAVLRQAGHTVTPVDLSVTALPRKTATQARFVAIAAPMHTALRLGVRAAEDVRALNPTAHICFYGLYAWLNADYLLSTVADSVISGEYEEPLVALANHLKESGHPDSPDSDPVAIPGVSTRAGRARPHMSRLSLPVPDRAGLPDLSHYARYLENERYALSGYVESSRGCLHNCRHCPIVPVYGGRFFVVPFETVMADIHQQVAAGAEHITFGDPDFLNGPGHAMKLARALHAAHPNLTFDFTTKVEHIIQHRALMPELRALGAGFIVSAFESVSDEVLRRLQKGHTPADMDLALEILDAARLPVQPTWLPFTPWTSMDDYLAMLAWIRERGLAAHVPAVQLSIRLLIPPNSALLAESPPGALGELDPARFSYAWRHPDPRMDELQARVTVIAEGAADGGSLAAFNAIERLAYGMANRPQPVRGPRGVRLRPTPPRLTEDWFC
ncbi:MAG: radical SAM protein [Anaerolineae bacterium]|nr:MAG: radical SAM protein [Anaerolineae bacterium]